MGLGDTKEHKGKPGKNLCVPLCLPAFVAI
jgi:hypothetical protein